MTTATVQSMSFCAAEPVVKAPSKFAAMITMLRMVNLRASESDQSRPTLPTSIKTSSRMQSKPAECGIFCAEMGGLIHTATPVCLPWQRLACPE
jgi:hypothetical protein